MSVRLHSVLGRVPKECLYFSSRRIRVGKSRRVLRGSARLRGFRKAATQIELSGKSGCRLWPTSSPTSNWAERQVSDELPDVETHLFLEGTTSADGQWEVPTLTNWSPKSCRSTQVVNARYGGGISQMATTGNGLLEPGNISAYQRSKMKVRNVELAISVGQR